MHLGLVSLCLSTSLAAAGKPALDCGPMEVNFGVVPQGRQVRAERTCRNTGSSELTLMPPVTACSCLGAKFDHVKLAPGGKAKLLMTLETSPLSDRVEFAVDLPLRASDSIALTLMVSADVRPSVIAVPEYVDLGDYRKSPVRQVLIVDTTGRSFTIRQATSARSEVDVRWTPVELIRMGDRWEPSTSRGAVTGYHVTLTVRPPVGRNSISDEVEIELTNELQKSLRLRVVGYSP